MGQRVAATFPCLRERELDPSGGWIALSSFDTEGSLQQFRYYPSLFGEKSRLK